MKETWTLAARGWMMGKTLVEGLEAIVGGENVAVGPEAARKFLRAGAVMPEWIRVCPGTTEEVQAIVRLARERRVGILTCPNRYALPEDLLRKGILVDFSRMDRVERIDTRNLVAHIERGVTWGKLKEALKPLGVKTYAPVAANSFSSCGGKLFLGGRNDRGSVRGKGDHQVSRLSLDEHEGRFGGW